jgi:hypothetical protein
MKLCRWMGFECGLSVGSLPRGRDGGDDSWSAFCCDACSYLCGERLIEGGGKGEREKGRRGGSEEPRGACGYV